MYLSQQGSPQSPVPDTKMALLPESLTQQRQGVQKDIWTTKGGPRLHTRLNAERSDVAIKGHKEIVETLQNITCWTQQAVDTSTQEVRYFTTHEGVYVFPSHRFLAEEVHLAFYQLPGSSLPASPPTTPPFLSGIAEEVILSAGLECPAFTAHHLRANVEQWP